MTDGSFVRCSICGHEAKSIVFHIRNFHSMETEDYKSKYGGEIEAPEVNQKREKTSLERYGVKHYTNREAANFSFQQYEGGHPFKDKSIRDKANATKEEKYGDPNYTNKEKTKQTNLERYGVEHSCANKQVIEKRIKTLKDRYGRVFNVDTPHNKTDVPEDFKDKFYSNKTIEELSQHYKVSDPTVSRWIKEIGIKREAVKATERDLIGTVDLVLDYFKCCVENKETLSFYAYGKIKGQSYCLKMKRLFNAGKRYSSLKNELFKLVSEGNLTKEFMENFI
jgi:hypothetical protein